MLIYGCALSNRRRRIAVNLAPCSCAGEVEYDSTLLPRARRKTLSLTHAASADRNHRFAFVNAPTGGGAIIYEFYQVSGITYLMAAYTGASASWIAR